MTIKETQTFTTATHTDFSTQVNALASSGVKVVFIPIYAEEASTFLTQAKGKFADDVYFFGADGLDLSLIHIFRRAQLVHQQDVPVTVTQGRRAQRVEPIAGISAAVKQQIFRRRYSAHRGQQMHRGSVQHACYPHRAEAAGCMPCLLYTSRCV